jgi:tRNA(fMet)-specific endonuclease VapC
VSYLLDTSTLLEVLRASPPAALVRRLSQVPPRERLTSVITVSQLLLAARRENDARLMQDVVGLVAAIRVAPYDLSAAQAFAKFRAGIAAEGETDDVMIAAIASSKNYTLVTRRRGDFEAFPLRIEDWTVAQ